MATVGCFTAEKAFEDIEIGLAALERRPPDLECRSSPNKTAALGDVGRNDPFTASMALKPCI